MLASIHKLLLSDIMLQKKTATLGETSAQPSPAITSHHQPSPAITSHHQPWPLPDASALSPPAPLPGPKIFSSSSASAVAAPVSSSGWDQVFPAPWKMRVEGWKNKLMESDGDLGCAWMSLNLCGEMLVTIDNWLAQSYTSLFWFMLDCRSSPWKCRNRAGTWSVGCPVHANRKGIVCAGLCFWRVQDKLHTTSTRHWKNVTMNTHESWPACLSTSWSKKCWFIVVKISGCKLADMEITRQPAVYCCFSLKVQQCYTHRVKHSSTRQIRPCHRG